MGLYGLRSTALCCVEETYGNGCLSSFIIMAVAHCCSQVSLLRSCQQQQQSTPTRPPPEGLPALPFCLPSIPPLLAASKMAMHVHLLEQ